MSSISFTDVFGYHASNAMPDVKHEAYASCFLFTASFMSVVVSPLIGLIRIMAHVGLLLNVKEESLSQNEIQLSKYNIVRGVMEVLCLGPAIALLLDTSFTIYRACNVPAHT